MFKFINKVDFKTFDEIFDGVLVIDKNRRIVFANKKAKEILGEVKEGESCRGLFSICEHCPMELVEDSEQGVQVYDVLTKRKNHVCLSMSPLFEGGEFTGVLEVFRDVSKVIHYMEEVKRQKEFVEVVLDSIVEAVLVLDEKGNVINHNGNASKVLCSRFESITGKNLKEITSLSLEDLPPEGERADIYIETPCGRQKASVLLSKLKQGKGWVLSLYIVPEIFAGEGNKLKIVTKSPKFLKVLEKVKTISEMNVNVLITGETGTGKSLLARYIHYLSPRRDKPFVKINCGAIPENLLEA
ncbi:putative protein [Aquifex aeolicus VF5]|uniref:Sigma-54 factor interaction domain-containing protein n=1 Tax=Aquifex aeolicus (strain VF5) TaxID=224324 RepID=O66501_AQUAE|nr:putative protein [Aquifex aeolicus VF5]